MCDSDRATSDSATARTANSADKAAFVSAVTGRCSRWPDNKAAEADTSRLKFENIPHKPALLFAARRGAARRVSPRRTELFSALLFAVHCSVPTRDGDVQRFGIPLRSSVRSSPSGARSTFLDAHYTSGAVRAARRTERTTAQIATDALPADSYRSAVNSALR